MNKQKAVRIPEPDFTERIITVVTPTTYSSRTVWEPTATYKKRMKEMRRHQRKIKNEKLS